MVVGEYVGLSVVGRKVGAVVGLAVSSGQSPGPGGHQHQAAAREGMHEARRRAAALNEGECILAVQLGKHNGVVAPTTNIMMSLFGLIVEARLSICLPGPVVAGPLAGLE